MTDFDTFDTTDRNRRYGLPDPFLLPPTPSQDGQTDPYPTSERAVTAMLLGSGELGKEIAIELIRLGVVVIAVDSYSPAPAMQVAQGSA
ncbi:MAG: phosphoribosylglycinamide formyltransferase 2, partial [Parascardovia denticolens]